MSTSTNANPLNDVLHIYTDGASRQNPGPSALAFIFVQNGEVIQEHSEFLGTKTNNQAEYLAIIEALLEAKKITNGDLIIFSDSEVVIKQLIGEYKVKNEELRKHRTKIFAEKKYFTKIKFTHVARQNKWIKMADKLCNRCLNLNT